MHDREWIARAALAVSLLGAGGCASLDGEVRVPATPNHAERVLHPATCQSGQVRGFFGVDLDLAPSESDHDASTVQLRAISDVIAGPRVRLSDEHGMIAELNPAVCRELDSSFELEPVDSRGVVPIDGHVAFDCAVDGRAYRGQVQVTGCTRSP